nr:uncharacterized protein LOC101239334 [Hydra vulgaris]
MKELQTKGNEKLQVNIKAIVCDAPARAFVKCIIGHSGYHSCERCVEVGTQMQGVRILETNASLRTDVPFKNNLYKEGHQLKSLSLLVQLNLYYRRKMTMAFCESDKDIVVSDEEQHGRHYLSSNDQRISKVISNIAG